MQTGTIDIQNKAPDLLSRLRALGVVLGREGDQLLVSAPPGVLDTSLQAVVREQKHALLELLAREQEARESAVVPLAPAQEGVWLAQELDPDGTAYNLTAVVGIEGPLDVERLARAVEEVVRRHAPLRSTFDSTPSGPIMRQAEVPAGLLELIDVAALPAEEQERTQREVVTGRQSRPFDLRRELPIRAALVRRSADVATLVTTFHHIAMDGVSLQHFYRGLAAGYAGETQAPLATTYAAYAVDERAHWTGDEVDQRLDFWRQELAGAPAGLELPTDQPRAGAQSYRGGLVHAHLAGPAWTGLQRLAQQERASLFMTLLAAYAAALHRHTAQRDLVIGTPLHGRHSPEYAELVGMFVNQLPLRIHIPPVASFRDLLRHTREATLRTLADRELPFHQLVHGLGVSREQGRTPIFQALLNVAPPLEVMKGVQAGPVTLRLPEPSELLRLFDGQSKFDLTLYALPGQDELTFALIYNAELFSAERMQTLMADVTSILTEAAEAVDQRLHERWARSIPASRGGIAGPDPGVPELSVAARFTRIAAEFAERPAVIGVEGELTYRELYARACSIAHMLRQQDADERPVGILVPHEPVLVPAILGALLAGRAYVPLDASYPAERLGYMVRDSGAATILTTAKLREKAVALAGSAVVLTIEQATSSAPAPGAVAPDTVAYLLYTSGSTGRPKAVVQVQGNIVRQADRYARALAITPEDRIALLASISFDACLMDLFGALLTGAAIAPVDPRATDLARLPQVFSERRLSVLHVTPTLFRALKEHVADLRFGTVRAVDLGGEAMRPDDVAFFDTHFPADAILVNSYGPSEHTFALGFRVPRDQRSNEVPIGWPIGDVEVLMLDPETGQEDPVSGVLALRSAYGALRYWNNPEATAAAFLPDPLHPGRTLYRTGDVVRRRADGAYVFLHREDHQLKIRGHRVEPAEIESVLREHPAVTSAAVHAPIGSSGVPVLTGCVVPRDPATFAIDELIAFCGERLPAYMVPAAWANLDALPLTPSGKVDRLALPAGNAATDGELHVDARNEEEQVLVEIWRDLLGVEVVGVHSDFFQAGGHSLNAMQVIARVRDLLDVEVPLPVFFDAPTIAATADWIRAHRTGYEPPPPLCVRDDLPTRVPLSFSQERMWLLYQIAPDSAAYNMNGAVRLRGALDVERLCAAVELVIRRHESLRTVFPSEHGRPLQEVLEQGAGVRIEDFTGHGDHAFQGACDHAATFLEARYDLEMGPLFRLAVYRLGVDDHLVAVGMHHIIGDLWSFGVLGRELALAYEDLEAARRRPLPIRYRDFALWQRDWLRGEALERQVAYWHEQLVGVKPLDLPTDYPRPPLFSLEGDLLAAPLHTELRSAVERLASDNRATPFMVLLGAFYALLASYSGRTDIAVGSPVANRTLTHTEDLIGVFVNTLVHRNDLSGDPTFRELMARVRASTLEAFAHQETPFELLVKELQVPADASRPPLVQVLFNVANMPTEGTTIKGVASQPVRLERRAAHFDLTMNIALNTLQSEIALIYNTSLFSRRTAELILAQYVELLERAVENPDVRLSRLTAPAATQQRLLVEWNRTERDYPIATNVPALFTAAAHRDPGRIAVDSPTGSFTYAELLEYAQRVTAALHAAGVQPGDRVAILMERSREMLAALLGILGSGAAYVPVDPAYPEARVQYVLENSGARLVVTHRGLDRRLGLAARTLDLDTWTPPAPVAFVTTRPDQAAYAIYTSGSTGKPKGVEVPHGAMVNFLLSMQEQPGITADDTLLAVTTISFDISVLELFLPLITGARVVIASEDEALDGRRLMQRMEEHNVTLMQATPATWKLLLAAGWQGRARLRALCGGEALPRELADELLARVAALWNMYGPTETTVWSTIEQVSADGPIMIGQPIANTTVYVLGESMDLQPIGVPGELWIGGAGVASGYVNRPDLTDERFVGSPFRAGERLYRTGDLVRWRHDGRLEHLGRLDHQVKIRGFRIELGEVEAALLGHDAVRDTVVAAREDRLIGYVVFEAGRHATAAELRSWIGASLPPYMVPSAIVPLDALPLTPNGKVDRKQLPDPAGHVPDVSAWAPPTDPIGREIAAVWSELLGIDHIGVEDRFFEIGGHSLLAMEAVAMIEERTGNRPEPRSMFFMTLAELAAAIGPATVG